jgi:hypothetical protein
MLLSPNPESGEITMSFTLHGRPIPEECAPHHAKFLAEMEETEIFGAFLRNQRDLGELARRFAGDASLLRYAPDKWSVRELVGHIIDAERVFGYRILAIARGDAKPLPGFDDKSYALEAQSDRHDLPTLVADFEAIRNANQRLLRSLPEEAWARKAEVGGHVVSLRAVAWFAAAHANHHLIVLGDRYLPLVEE